MTFSLNEKQIVNISGSIVGVLRISRGTVPSKNNVEPISWEGYAVCRKNINTEKDVMDLLQPNIVNPP